MFNTKIFGTLAFLMLFAVTLSACESEPTETTDAGSDAGDDAAACGEAGCGECTTNGDCADRAVRTICNVERRRCVACVKATDCAKDHTCENELCILKCGPGGTCPSGYHCAGADADKQCFKKDCEQSSDCTDSDKPHCDTTDYVCTEKPLPQVKPTLAFFRASPPAVPLGTASTVVFSFAFKTIPSPVPTCTVSGAGAVVLAEEGNHTLKAKVTISNPLAPSAFTLECKSPAGDATATAYVAGMAPFSFTGTLTPAGTSLSMGQYSFKVPPGAVSKDTQITVKIAPSAAESESLMGVVASFEPHGLTLQQPLTLSMPYNETLMAAAGWSGVDLTQMVIGSSQGTSWRRLRTTIDPVAKTLTGQLQHFSEYVPMDGTAEEGWHPLAAGSNAKDSDLVRQDELVLLRGPTSGTKNRGNVIDDAKHGYSYLDPVPLYNDEDGTHRVDQALLADVDDDGRDELVYTMFYKRSEKDLKAKYGFKIKVLDDAVDNKGLLFTVDSGDNYTNVNSIYRVDVKAGQFNGEGAEELVIAFSTCKYHKASSSSWHEAIRYKRDSGVYTVRYDPQQANKYKVIDKDFGLSGVWDVSVAVGDLDGEGRDDVVVTGRTTTNSSNFYNENYRRMKVWVYEDEVGNFELKKTLYKASGSTLLNGYARVSHPLVSISAVDDDDKEEIVISGIVDNQTAYLERFNDASSDYKLISSIDFYKAPQLRRLDDLRLISVNMARDAYWEPVVAVYDSPDGSSVAPLWRVFHLPSGAGASPFKAGEKQFAQLSLHKTAEPQGLRLASGDMDRDGRDELYLGYRAAGATHAHFVEQWFAKDNGSSYELKYGRDWNKGGNESATVIALGDIDGDSVRVRYTGKRETGTADPQISLVMLTPPTKAGISQNHGGSKTTYGDNSSSSASQTTSIGVKATNTVSYKGKVDPLGVVEYEMNASFTNAFNLSKTTTSSESYGIYNSIAHDENGGGAVIFTSQTYDSYEYEVLAHSDPDRDPNKDPDNKYISIDVPEHEATMHRWDIDYFNQNNGDAPDIGAETFTHTNGDPASYPTAQEKNDLIQKFGGWENGPLAVAQGSGNTMLTITVGKSTSTGNSHSFGVTLGAGLTIAKSLSFKSSVSATTSWAYKVTCGKSLVYRGSVGAISDASDYSKHKYKYGLFIYDLQRSDHKGLMYQVINYWVQDYNP